MCVNMVELWCRLCVLSEPHSAVAEHTVPTASLDHSLAERVAGLATVSHAPLIALTRCAEGSAATCNSCTSSSPTAPNSSSLCQTPLAGGQRSVLFAVNVAHADSQDASLNVRDERGRGSGGTVVSDTPTATSLIQSGGGDGTATAPGHGTAPSSLTEAIAREGTAARSVGSIHSDLPTVTVSAGTALRFGVCDGDVVHARVLVGPVWLESAVIVTAVGCAEVGRTLACARVTVCVAVAHTHYVALVPCVIEHRVCLRRPSRVGKFACSLTSSLVQRTVVGPARLDSPHYRHLTATFTTISTTTMPARRRAPPSRSCRRGRCSRAHWPPATAARSNCHRGILRADGSR
jgi:hypothetical protein